MHFLFTHNNDKGDFSLPFVSCEKKKVIALVTHLVDSGRDEFQGY